jgi:hypothetical protein
MLQSLSNLAYHDSTIVYVFMYVCNPLHARPLRVGVGPVAAPYRLCIQGHVHSRRLQYVEKKN